MLEELKGRIGRFQQQLAAQGLAGAMLMQITDRYYFTLTAQNGYVYIPAQGEPLVLIRKDYGRACEESPLKIDLLASVKDLAPALKAAYGEVPSPMGVEMDVLPVEQFKRLQNLLPGVEFKDCSKALMKTRAVKSPWEIEKIEKSADMVREVIGLVPSILHEGITELALAARIEYEFRMRGHGGYANMRGFNQRLFFGHIFAGPTAAEPSGFDFPTCGKGLSPLLAQGASKRAIGRGEPINVDVVGLLDGYLCDQTRLFAMGQLEPLFVDAFKVAKEIQDEIASMAKPGANAGELYNHAIAMAKKTPYAGNFMGDGLPVPFVGHGIGLEVDELPVLAKGADMILEEGMVFALEPKFIFKGRGVAGIEDTYVVAPGGARLLTSSPREIITV